MGTKSKYGNTKVQKELLRSLQYTIVEISSIQILDIGNNPVILLPESDVNTYYDIDKIIFEYTHNTTAYSTSNLVLNNNWSSTIIAASMLDESLNLITIIKQFNMSLSQDFPSDVRIKMGQILPNTGLTLSTVDNVNPINGDGTLLVKIWYEIINVGS